MAKQNEYLNYSQENLNDGHNVEPDLAFQATVLKC